MAPNAPPTSGVMIRTWRGLQSEQLGETVAGTLRALVRDPGGQPAVLAPDRGAGPRLHRGGRDPLVDDRVADHDLAALEQVRLQRGCLAPVAGDVAPGRLEQQRAVVRLEAQHGRQRVVVHLDQLDGILALVGVLGHDDGDGLPDEADLVGRQEPLRHLDVHQPGRSRRNDRKISQVCAGVGGHHSRRCQRRGDIDAVDARVGERGADEEHVVGAVETVVHDVLGIHAAGSEELRILCPQDPRTQDAQLTISSSRRPCTRVTGSAHVANPAVLPDIPEGASSAFAGYTGGALALPACAARRGEAARHE